MTPDEVLLEQFVASFARTDELIEPVEEIPAELRNPAMADEYGDVYWHPIPYLTAEADIELLEALLPAGFPPLYRKLVSSYRYLLVDIGSCHLLGNPPSPGLDGLFDAMFYDQYLSSVLNQRGFIQFGRPENLDYDPVCFNTARRNFEGDMEVVQLDHEQILCYEKIRVISVLAPSFRALVEKAVAA